VLNKQIFSFLSILATAWAIPCGYTFPAPNKATFDLSTLTKTSDSYFARDSDTTDPFFYHFNVCENLAQLPPTNPVSLCADPNNNLFPAYQVVNSSSKYPGGACFAIGSLQNPTWAFINENDESIGVKLTYNGGSSTQCTTPRKLQISFRCPHAGLTYRRRRGVVYDIGTVYEDKQCEYYLDFYTIHACPQECFPKFSVDNPRDDSICNDQGLCSIDEDTQSAGCFCFKGKGGADCSQDVSGELTGTNPTTALVAIIFTLLALIVLLAVVLFFKIRKLNADDSNYGQLKEESVTQNSLPSAVP